MTQMARLRAYIAQLPPGMHLTARGMALVLRIDPRSASVALRRLAERGELVQQPRPASRQDPSIFETVARS